MKHRLKWEWLGRAVSFESQAAYPRAKLWPLISENTWPKIFHALVSLSVAEQ